MVWGSEDSVLAALNLNKQKIASNKSRVSINNIKIPEELNSINDIIKYISAMPIDNSDISSRITKNLMLWQLNEAKRLTRSNNLRLAALHIDAFSEITKSNRNKLIFDEDTNLILEAISKIRAIYP